MLKESGMVVSTDKDRATVLLVRSEACGNCPAKAACHATSDGNMTMEVTNHVEARPGDRVEIELEPSALLKASTLAYLMPALVTLVGAFIGWSLVGSDAGAMAGAAGGLAASSLFLFLYSRLKKNMEIPVISRVLPVSGSQHL